MTDTERDAARYRWLRGRYRALDFCYGREEDEDGNKDAGWPAVVLRVPDRSAWPAPWPGVPSERFDAAVDACIAAEPVAEGGDRK